MKETISSVMSKKTSVIIFCAVILAALMGIVLKIASLDEINQRANLQERVLAQTSDLRTQIEKEINTTLILTMGSLVYVAFNPDIRQEEFARFAKNIIHRAPYIQNLALAKDNVITHIYPVEGNEKALGLRYMENPSQRVAVLRAIELREAVIAGPVNLVQGGRGFISRIPIFLEDPEDSYWGIASIVILVDEFFAKINLAEAEKSLNISIRGRDAEGMQGDVFYGSGALFEEPQNIIMRIPLPVGSWVLAAAPKDGWMVKKQRLRIIQSGGFVLALFITALIYSLLMKNIALKQEKQNTEMAVEHKNRFFSYMAHELRTPLTAIQGVVKLLKSGNVSENSSNWDELLNNADRNCWRLQWLVNDILDMRKFESGKIEYHMDKQPVVSLVQEASDELSEFAGQFDIEIAIEETPEHSILVNVDSQRIKQVMANLLSNAIKASPGKSRVEVAVVEQPETVRVEVHDFGAGINPSKLDEIFIEFSQSPEAGEYNKKTVASTGLGLTISKYIIEGHGGQIGCYNKESGGAVFYFELPKCRAEPDPSNARAA